MPREGHEQFKTGNIAPEAGVYTCNSCGTEINMDEGDRLPPCGKDSGTAWSFSESGSKKSSKSSSSYGARSKGSSHE